MERALRRATRRCNTDVITPVPTFHPRLLPVGELCFREDCAWPAPQETGVSGGRFHADVLVFRRAGVELSRTGTEPGNSAEFLSQSDE